VLLLRTCGKLVEVYAAHSGIALGDCRQGSPEGALSNDPERQRFQRFKGAEGATPELQAAHLFA
jgi:hypothetical protein